MDTDKILQKETNLEICHLKVVRLLNISSTTVLAAVNSNRPTVSDFSLFIKMSPPHIHR